jgi:hypothetical protein
LTGISDAIIVENSLGWEYGDCTVDIVGLLSQLFLLKLQISQY